MVHVETLHDFTSRGRQVKCAEFAWAELQLARIYHMITIIIMMMMMMMMVIIIIVL